MNEENAQLVIALKKLGLDFRKVENHNAFVARDFRYNNFGIGMVTDVNFTNDEIGCGFVSKGLSLGSVSIRRDVQIRYVEHGDITRSSADAWVFYPNSPDPKEHRVRYVRRKENDYFFVPFDIGEDEYFQKSLVHELYFEYDDFKFFCENSENTTSDVISVRCSDVPNERLGPLFVAIEDVHRQVQEYIELHKLG